MHFDTEITVTVHPTVINCKYIVNYNRTVTQALITVTVTKIVTILKHTVAISAQI